MELPITPKRKSKNYRMSEESIALIAQIAEIKDTTVSDVLDHLVLLTAPRILDGLNKAEQRK